MYQRILTFFDQFTDGFQVCLYISNKYYPSKTALVVLSLMNGWDLTCVIAGYHPKIQDIL